MKIFAHRGFSGRFLENTRSSFVAAAELGVYGIENDVQLTKDGVVIVFHDEKLDKLTNGKGNVAESTLAELKRLRFKEDATEEILTLDEYLDIVEGKNIVSNIELKTGLVNYPGIAVAVYEAFDKRRMTDKLLVSSFNVSSLSEMKQIDKNIPCATLIANYRNSVENVASLRRFEFIHPYYKCVTKELVDTFKDTGVGMNAWTINSTLDYDKMVQFGVDGVITDFPNRFMRN